MSASRLAGPWGAPLPGRGAQHWGLSAIVIAAALVIVIVKAIVMVMIIVIVIVIVIAIVEGSAAK